MHIRVKYSIMAVLISMSLAGCGNGYNLNNSINVSDQQTNKDETELAAVTETTSDTVVDITNDLQNNAGGIAGLLSDPKDLNESTGNLQLESEPVSNSTQESSAVNPILIVISNLLIGAYQGNEWVTYQSVFSDISDNTEFSVYANYKYLGSGILKGIDTGEPYSISGFEDFYDDYVALSNNDKALKRIPEFDDEKKHREILTSVLQKQGLDNFTPNVTDAIDVDLDGDGKEELITIGSSYNEEDCIEEAVYKVNNNYSVMIFSKEENGEYNSTVMDESTGYKIEDSTLEASDNNKDMMIMDEYYYSVIGCLDINNDNILEVVIKDEGFGGAEYEIYEFSNGRFEIVLEDFYGYR